MTHEGRLKIALALGMDCAKGTHVCILGQPCLGCGDSGPTARPYTKPVLRDAPRAQTTLPT